MTRKLREQQVISNGLFFSLWARFNGAEKKIHQGLYRFENSVAPWEVLERLVAGKGIFHSVTIPEGLTIKEIAELLDKMQIADKAKFLAAAADSSVLTALGLGDKGLEGYLFPSTYHFTPATPEREIIIAMAEQFRRSAQPLLAKTAMTAQFSTHELLTLASIVEAPAPLATVIARRERDWRGSGARSGRCGVSQPAQAPDAAAERPDGDLRPQRFQRRFDQERLARRQSL